MGHILTVWVSHFGCRNVECSRLRASWGCALPGPAQPAPPLDPGRGAERIPRRGKWTSKSGAAELSKETLLPVVGRRG